MIKQLLFFVISCIGFWNCCTAQNYVYRQNVSYISPLEKDTYKKERCVLDLYYPENKKGFATIVWFHGGALETGEKFIPEGLKNKGVAVIAVNYRLSPKVKNPAYIEDAAAAVAWVFKHIDSLGGNSNLVYVSGHSAGGYLALMVGLDQKYLAAHGVAVHKIKGLMPISGQTNTHYTIRKERALPMDTPLIDGYAPLNLVRKGVPPILLITGDRRLELMARYEENAHLEAVLKGIGNTSVQLYELQGFDHGTVVSPACNLMIDWVKKQSQ